MALSDVVLVAQEMIAELGDRAASAMEARARAHAEAGEIEGAVFWSQVATAARALLGQRLAENKFGRGHRKAAHRP